jgi:cytochrome c biogenesis protein CcmG/thiol:disulfide interchange protein DsbE
MKRALAFAPLALLALLAIASGLVLMQGGARRDLAETGLVGRPIPAYDLENLHGGARLTPADMKGQVFLVNLYASWCAPCRIEHPLLATLARQEGVPVIGIAYKDKPEAAKGFLAELGDPYKAVGLDPEGRYGLEIGIAGVPETFVVDAQGRIRLVIRGPLTEANITEKVLPIIKAAREGR